MMTVSTSETASQHDTITATLTNPGIIDRLEQDVADYLSPFGFRLERQSLQEEGPRIGHESNNSRAVLTIPRLPYRYSIEKENSNTIDALRAIPAAGSNSTPTPVAQIANGTKIVSSEGPIGTVNLQVHQESLLATVGPLLRTFLRLSPGHISPLRLRSVIDCHFILDPLEKIDKMNSEQKRNQLDKQEELSARKMAHHVHMLVRNSMGSALCLEVVVILPHYRRRKMMEASARAGTGAAMTVDSVLSAMNENPNACYPSVRLVEQSESEAYDGNAIRTSAKLDLAVKTRMCTVRYQPSLFRWLRSLQYSTATDDESAPSVEGVESSIKKLPATRPEPIDLFENMPLFVTCIEKVANLHRILMLCHDYDMIYCKSKMDDGCGVREDEENASESTLLSNFVVVLPNARHELTLHEFECAIDHFHKVIVDPKRDMIYEQKQTYRPTFVYEDLAAEMIHARIKQQHRQLHFAQSTQPYQPSIVGIDLHPDALTLRGDYAATPNNRAPSQTASPALQKLRNADAIVFGYESNGIPETVAGELSGWVQIPSRSSINVVAAMSIVLDALLGVGAGVDIHQE